jgi:hypothetical protein
MTRHPNPISLVGRALRRDGTGNEEKDLRRKGTPSPRDPDSFRPDPASCPRRSIAPEIRQHSLDEVDALDRRRQVREGFPRDPIRAGDADPSLREPDAGPAQEKRKRTETGRFPPEAPNGENATEDRDEERSPLPLIRTGSQKDSGDERRRRRQRGRFAGACDRTDQDAPVLRTSVMTDSTRCVRGKRSYSRASVMSKTESSSARSRASVAESQET